MKCCTYASLCSYDYYFSSQKEVKQKRFQQAFILEHDGTGVNLLLWHVRHKINCSPYSNIEKPQKYVAHLTRLALRSAGVPGRSMVHSADVHFVFPHRLVLFSSELSQISLPRV